jgi:hypothetical protein
MELPEKAQGPSSSELTVRKQYGAEGPSSTELTVREECATAERSEGFAPADVI